MKFNVILAVDKFNGIAKEGISGMNIPWHFSEDLKYFKRMTSHTTLPNTQNAIIMGRKTADTLPNKFLPNRLNIVLTRNNDYINDNAIKVDTFNKALKIAEVKEIDTVWIIGGA